MGNISKKKTSKGRERYYARVRLQGYYLTKPFGSEKAAQKWIATTEDKIERGLPVDDTLDLRKTTLGELIDRFIEESLDTGSPVHCENVEAQLRWWNCKLISHPKLE